MGIYDFLFAKIFSTFDKDSIEGRKKIGDELLIFLMRIVNEIVKEHYLKKLAKDLGTSYESIVREGERIEKKEIVPKSAIAVKKDKRDRREILEEYLVELALKGNKMAELPQLQTDFLEDASSQ